MDKKTIAIIGANGQLGTDLTEIFQNQPNITLIPLSHKEIEITNPESIRNAFPNKPDVIINTAAYNRVDDAETNLKKTFLVNATAVKYLAQYAQQEDIVFMHISSDYVFGIEKERSTPYTEDDAPGPVNTYGISKLTGEYFARSYAKKHFVVRTSGLFGKAGAQQDKGNFVETILRIAKEKGLVKVVNDQILTPTYSKDLATQLSSLLNTNNFGLYHATQEGSCSWYEFTMEIFKLTGIKTEIIPITSDQFTSAAMRPLYSVLENEKLKKLGIYIMRSWQDALKDYLTEK